MRRAWTPWTALSFGLLLVAPAFAAPEGRKTLFRYRSFQSAPPPEISPIDPVGGIDHDSRDFSDRGHGFSDFFYTNFDGLSQYIRATNSIDSTDDSGDDSFTIQAWFRASSTDGYRTLISNTAGNRGLSLEINDGQLRGLVRIDQNGTSVDQELIGGTISPDTTWYRVAFRVEEQSSTYELRLFVDGSEVASSTVAREDGIRQSTERPMVGAEPLNGVPEGQFFHGSLHAVSITNYAIPVDAYLENPMARDGSDYFGLVSFHDYLDSTDGPDLRTQNTVDLYPDVDQKIVRRFHTPFLNDNYIPQGMAAGPSGLLYMSSYWKDHLSKEGSYPSSVLEMTTDGALNRVSRLKTSSGSDFTHHVGGIAYRNGYLYTYEDGTANVPRFDLTTVDSLEYVVGTDFCNVDGDPEGNTRISYVSISEDHDGTPVLWTGQYDDSLYMYIRGFAIDDSDGSVIGSIQRHAYKLPVVKVQGIDCYLATDRFVRFYVATSTGNAASHIYDVLYRRGIDDESPLSSAQIFEGPAGAEDLAMIDDELWSVSESGARHYQKRASAPWSQCVPFNFALAPDLVDVYVDGAAPSGGDGSAGSPFDSVADGVGATPTGSAVVIAAGSYPESLIADRAMLFEVDGTVTIGQ